MRCRVLVLLWICGLCGTLPARASRFYVDNAPGGAGDDRRSVRSAQDPRTPFRTITHALRVAHQVAQGRPHVIEIAAGTYSRATGETLPLVISQPGILLKASGTVILDGEHAAELLRFIGPVGSQVVKDFHLINGAAVHGGAILARACSLRVEDCRFSDNRASSGGHVLYAEDSWIEFLGNRVVNSGPGAGGVLEVHGQAPGGEAITTIRNNTFYRPYASAIVADAQRIDIDSNIFFDTAEPVLVNPVPDVPWVRYNLFYPNAVLFVDSRGDSIQLGRTVRDTLILNGEVVSTSRFIPDTTGAMEALDGLVPSFASAASGGGNVFAPPAFLDTTYRHFEPRPESAALDGGNPVVSLRDPAGEATSANDTRRNNIGETGGPAGAPVPLPDTTFVEREILTLPDSVVTEGQTWVYTPVLASGGKILLTDLIPDSGPPTMTAYGTFGHAPPITWTPTFADTGSYLIGAISYTNGGYGRQFIPLHVRPLNEPPIFTSRPDTVAPEHTLYTYRAVASDAEGDPVSYALVEGAEGMTLDSGTGLLSWTPADVSAGPAQVVIRARDQHGAATDQRFSLRVVEINDPPSITSTADSLATEDVPYLYRILAADPDADATFLYSLVQAPDSATVDSAGQLTWTPRQADVGLDTFLVRVTDQGGLSAEQQFVVRVREVDSPPVFTSRPDTLAWEDSTYAYQVTLDDEEGGPLQLRLTAAPDGASLDSTGRLTWTPIQRDVGVHTVILEAEDPGGLVATQHFALRVQAVDDPPRMEEISPAPGVPLEVTPGESRLFQVRAVDEEDDPLRFTWIVNGRIRTDVAGASMEFVPSTDRLDTLRVDVSDGTHTTTTRWFVDGRAEPRLAMNDSALDLGTVGLGDTSRVCISLRNDGYADLVLDSLQLSDLQLAAAFQTSLIPPGGESALVLRYAPLGPYVLAATVRFVTNDPARPRVQLEITGRGGPRSAIGLDLDPTPGDQHLSASTVRPGGRFSLAVYLETVRELTRVDARLAFPARHIRLQAVVARLPAEPNLLDAAGSPATISTHAEADGTMDVGLESTAGPVSGDGLLAVLTFAADSAFFGQDSVVIHAVSAILRGPPGTVADTLNSQIQVRVRARTLAADFDGDGQVDFSDFFLFADHFLGAAIRYDLDGSGRVDLEDFFLFAESFGRHHPPAAARPAVDLPPPASGTADLELYPESSPLAPDAAFSVRTRTPGRVSGYALELHYDADALLFREFTAPRSEHALAWVADTGPGCLLLAAALPRGAVMGADGLGMVRFSRRKSAETTLSVTAGVIRTPEGLRGLRVLPAHLPARPSQCALLAPYPNPFNSETVVRVYLPASTALRLTVFDLLGRPVADLFDGSAESGLNQYVWDGRDDGGDEAATGVYFVQLRTATLRRVRKVILVR